MWFLIPIAIGGGLLLRKIVKSNKKTVFKNMVDKTDETQEEVQLEHRRVYVCHSYYDSSTYRKLISKLKMNEEYKVFNHSIPEEKKRHDKNSVELKAIFRQQMAGCSHVFVLASTNIPKKSFVKMELEVAKELGKEIIAIVGRDQYGMPDFIKKLADKKVTNDTRNLKKQLIA